jgi:hypothetical protein
MCSICGKFFASFKGGTQHERMNCANVYWISRGICELFNVYMSINTVEICCTETLVELKLSQSANSRIYIHTHSFFLLLRLLMVDISCFFSHILYLYNPYNDFPYF